MMCFKICGGLHFLPNPPTHFLPTGLHSYRPLPRGLHFLPRCSQKISHVARWLRSTGDPGARVAGGVEREE